MEFLSKEIILGLSVQEFLLHFFNFAILMTALFFLLYKPVKKFMAKRDSDYKKAEEGYKTSVKEINQAKDESERILSEAREEAVYIAEEAHALAMVQTEEILNSAKDEAKDLLTKAKDDSKSIYEKEKQELYYAISDLAVDISQKLLDRNFTTEDNDKLIDSIILEESKNGVDIEKEYGLSDLDKEKQHLYYSISDLAVDISEKLIGRDFTSEDNEKFIDGVIKDINNGEGNE